MILSFLSLLYQNAWADFRKSYILDGKIIMSVRHRMYDVRRNDFTQNLWYNPSISKLKLIFLYHLSRMLIGELIGYTWSGVRPAAASVVVHNAQDLLRNHGANQSQILCGASLGRRKQRFVRGIWVT